MRKTSVKLSDRGLTRVYLRHRRGVTYRDGVRSRQINAGDNLVRRTAIKRLTLAETFYFLADEIIAL